MEVSSLPEDEKKRITRSPKKKKKKLQFKFKKEYPFHAQFLKLVGVAIGGREGGREGWSCCIH